jgi:alpha-methylacyl-CoA racemase
MISTHDMHEQKAEMNRLQSSTNTLKATPRKVLPLKGKRLLSLSLNLPGPGALMRCAAMGATCTKLEPPSGDPMKSYQPDAYDTLHQGVKVKTLDLKTAAGLKQLETHLARSDVLLTSFRPSALKKLGLGWRELHQRHPHLNLVKIVGAPGQAAEIPGHDLTYQAEQDLVTGLNLPPSLLADMGGALMASEAVLQALLLQAMKSKSGQAPGVQLEVALSEAARWLALPRVWGLTQNRGVVGGAHAGYQVYRCKNGRVAVVALEPHFAQRLCQASGLDKSDLRTMMSPKTRAHLAAWMAGQTRAQLDNVAKQLDLPLMTLPA